MIYSNLYNITKYLFENGIGKYLKRIDNENLRTASAVPYCSICFNFGHEIFMVPIDFEQVVTLYSRLNYQSNGAICP